MHFASEETREMPIASMHRTQLAPKFESRENPLLKVSQSCRLPATRLLLFLTLFRPR
jgi:hypothetical protein